MSWVCDKCHSIMKVIRERKNRNKIECPNCGTYWFVDDNDEYINDGSAWSPDDEDNQENEDEGLSVYEAALIWASKGKDEDYMFGYTEEELEDAL